MTGEIRNFDEEPSPNRAERRRIERMLRSNKRRKRQVIFDPKNPPKTKVEK